MNRLRVLLVVCGSTSAADLPYWLSWMAESRPDIDLLPVLTHSAERFVTPTAVAGRSGVAPLQDQWPDDDLHARHVVWQEWADAIVVYPATLHFLARLALGLADSPALLAAQCTAAPVVLAPALPPGGVDSAAYRQHWAALSTRPNVSVVPPRPGISATTGRRDAWAPALLPDVLARVDELRAAAGEPSESPPSSDQVAHVDQVSHPIQTAPSGLFADVAP